MSDLSTRREQLLRLLASFRSCAVAFSGGVDSAVVAKAARLALGDQAIAVTGSSASLATGELENARRVAELIGIRQVVIETQEFSSPDYLRNSADRCYHCKSELYSRVEEWIGNLSEAVEVVVNGANADDLSDYRPGMRAAGEHAIRSPLAECGLTKADVRALAAEWELPVWDKPATPCLSSRVAYGEAVSPEKLQMIDAAEQYLRELGLREVRVRYHRDALARLEVPIDDVPRFTDPAVREPLVAKLAALGFRFVTLDLQGFRSGSLNSLVAIELGTTATSSRPESLPR